MDSKSCIFWFSGTGNSLYAAKKLGTELDVTLERITDRVPAVPIGGKGEKVGFVFPSYYCNLPRAVSAFIKKLEILPETYIFAIVTMGGVGQGSVHGIKKLLKTKGHQLSYGRGILMPANYVLNYDPADPVKSDSKLNKIDSLLSSIAADIRTDKETVRALPVTAGNLYKNIENLDEGFVANDDCTGCGICEKICPVSNIKMEESKPHWLRHCERCMACISWCPEKAIDYGNKTKNRKRYRNPRINVNELI